jgi:hypothetical protein
LAGKLALSGKLLSTLAAVGTAALLLFGPTTTPTQAFWWPDPWAGPWIAPWGLPLPTVWGPPLLAGPDAAPSSSTYSSIGSPAPALADSLGSQFRGAWLQGQLLQALNRGDAAAAGVYLADDAVYSISDGVGLCGPLPCVGRPAIQLELDRQVLVHTSYLHLGLEASGNTVIGRYAVTSDRVKAAGAQRVLGTVTSEVRTDKLTYIRISLERDDPQTALFLGSLVRDSGSGAVAPATTSAAPAAGGAAPAGAPGAGARGSATLAATLSSGVTGSATLAQSSETTSVTVTLSGMTPNSAHAGHIHRGGCSGAIILPLGVLTADASGQGSVTATVNAAIDAANWWIQYHTGDNPPGPPIACGPVVLGSS